MVDVYKAALHEMCYHVNSMHPGHPSLLAFAGSNRARVDQKTREGCGCSRGVFGIS